MPTLPQAPVAKLSDLHHCGVLVDNKPCCVDVYRFHTVTAGRGTGKKLMLLVHGFPELWYSWRWQLEAFKEDYEVVAFDLRGFGQTEKPQVLLGIVLALWPQLSPPQNTGLDFAGSYC